MKSQAPSFYFKKLHPVAYEAMDQATNLCTERTNPELELCHWLFVLLDKDKSDFFKILEHFGIDRGKVHSDLIRTLDGLQRGASQVSNLSKLLVDALELGWVTASLNFGEERLRSGHVVLAMGKNSMLRTYLGGLSEEFRKLNVDELEENFYDLTSGSAESGPVGEAATGGARSEGLSGKSALERFSVDLTERARQGEIDPVLCRDDEIRQIIDILMRRRQNNPILTGEAGVGKTAVVEGFAIRLAEGTVPPALQGVTLRTLDIGLLQAGASMKGEFEDRLRQVIEEVQNSPTPIIMFIDEAHTLIGAGGSEGTGDAANLLKPALARGTLRTVAATTWSEYKKHIEKDPALTRRFQVVKVEEPTVEQACLMLRGILDVLESHHGVEIQNDALHAAVDLSHRYIPARQLPDKAVSLLDTSCARVALSQNAAPAPVEHCREKIHHLELERDILDREIKRGRGDEAARAEVDEKLEAAKGRLEELEGQWKKEDEFVKSWIKARDEALAGDESKKAEVLRIEGELAKLQGETPLIHPNVTEHAVASIVADWTGIPVGKMVRDEIQSVLNLAEQIGARVVGQDHALKMIAKRIVTARAGIDNPSKPIGVFMLAGTSGVGKTETALALAEALYGGESNLITINMSEFQEAHTVSTLKGAPPGYVGYGEGGVLTEAVRRRPYSVVLLDEVEKAHPDVHEIFFQVFDKGIMEDGEGRSIDFKNTVILLTTNAGSDELMSMCEDPELTPEPDVLAQALRKPLLEVFPAALLGRIVTIPYYPLGDDVLKLIIRLQLGRIKKRLKQRKNIEFKFDEELVEMIFGRCRESESGARVIDAILTNTMLPDIGRRLLESIMHETPVDTITVKAGADGFDYEFS